MACGEKGNLEKLAYKLGIQPARKTRTPSHIVQTYDYRDEKTNLLFQVVRYILLRTTTWKEKTLVIHGRSSSSDISL